jgi:hypothetical protein
MQGLKRLLFAATNSVLSPFDFQAVSSRLDAKQKERIVRLESLRSSREEHLSLLINAKDKIQSASEESLDFLSFYNENFHISNSQWGQDIFVIYVMKSARSKTFLEIGGADGITHSNTLSLSEQFNWRGTLVEPDRHQYRSLTRFRPRDKTLNCAISPSGEAGMSRLITLGQLSCMEGHEPNDLHSSWRRASTETQEVVMININTLLAQQEDLCYFSLDVEGLELNILQQIDWKGFKNPECMTIEHNFQPEVKEEILRITAPQGYREAFPGQDWLTRGDVWLVKQ